MKRFQEISPHSLHEGVYDKNIFKAFFLAGGPGSGKTRTVKFTTGGSGLKIVNSDDEFERLLVQAGLSLKMPGSETEPRDVLRARAKRITALRKKNYVAGRLGLIIDGTGKDANKILRQKAKLEELGYDTYMIYVNTSIDVALERNAKRGRSVPEAEVVKSWKNVQSNIGKFSNMFRKGFVVVDNNNATDDEFAVVWKRISKLLQKKVTNTRATNWIALELSKKKR
ncbi:MAG TPA: hypothetical protein EYQ21_00075 [Flavobacteriales bacterium]|nr:hypothetical protein [Flavobacteriales bacterium]